MKKGLLVLVMVWSAFASEVSAQDLFAGAGESTNSLRNREVVSGSREESATPISWEFYSSTKEQFTEEEMAKAGNHLCGQEVACLLSQYYSMTLKKERLIEGDPTIRTVILKPAVYNAVKNIEKYYKKQSKESRVSQHDSEVMAHIVKVAIASLDSDTQDFEQVLQSNKKSVEEQILTFKRVQLNSIY